MNILFLSENAPSMLNGYDLRTFYLCKTLTDVGHNVYLVYFQKNIEAENVKSINYKVEREFTFPYPSLFSSLLGKFYKLIMGSKYLSRLKPITSEIKKYHSFLSSIVENYDIDVIHVNGINIGMLLYDYPCAPKLLDLADSQSLYFFRSFSIEKKLIKKIKNYFLFKWSRNLENNLLNNFNITTVVSLNDQKMLNKISRTSRTSTISNGIDTLYFSKKLDNGSDKNIIFHGNMNFQPNIDSALYIIKKINPLIKKKISDVNFYFVGNNPSKQLVELMNNNTNIFVTGFVDDIREYIMKASIGLYPMISGSGIKNKILEAMSMKLPVVTNPMGAEALSIDAKECLYIGETPEEIADHAVQLLENKNLRKKIGIKSREVMINEYSWEKTAHQFGELYISLKKD